MITIHTVTIIEKTRADYRRTLTELFLSEAPGAAGIPTKYEYNVETDNAGNIIYYIRVHFNFFTKSVFLFVVLK